MFFFDCDDAGFLRQLVERISPSSLERIEEIVIVVDGSQSASNLDPRAVSTARSPLVRIHRTPGKSSYGAARKAAFEYALRSGFERIVVMRGDGQHPPERIEDLMDATLERPHSLIIASRLSGLRHARRHGMSLGRIIALWLARALQNAVLGLRVQDYQSSFRLYPCDALHRIPWQLNSDARSFDDELLIQFRALGASTVEIPTHPVWLEYGRSSGLLERMLRSLQAAFGYRFHQLHLTRRHLYMVDQDIHYTLKSSSTSSHSQIVEAIAPGSRVLDLGCSQGLLARPLAEKNVRVTGVDSRPPEQLADELETYHQRDLEQEFELPEGRDFEYVVIADVIEHLRNRQQLLRNARRFLKEEGLLIISTPNIAIWFYRLSLLVGRFEYGPRGVLDETHVHLYTRQTFQREVERAGFRVIRRRVTALPFEVVFQATGKSRIVRWMAAGYYMLARAWPSMFAYQHILEAEIITLDEDGTSS